MARYLAAVGGDDEAALRLYGKQASISAALWQTIGHVEVVVRNAMNDVLSARSSEWYVDLRMAFNQRTLDDITDAQKRVREKVSRGLIRTETPGHVVAELNFGFWRFLLSKGYDRFLWVPYLHKAFPHLDTTRQGLFDDMRAINDARNAVAHHQRVDDPIAVRRTSLRVVGHICPHTRDWIRDECQVQAIVGS